MKFRRKFPVEARQVLPAALILALTAGPSVPLVLAHPTKQNSGPRLPSLMLTQYQTTTPAVPASPAPVTVPTATPVQRLTIPAPDAPPSSGNIPPAVKPDPSPDGMLLEQALAAAARDDWSTAQTYASETANPVLRDIIQWKYLLDEDSGASFDAIVAFLNSHPRWPRLNALLIRAEKTMPADLDPAQVIAWYGNRTPLSGLGMIHLGEALMSTRRVADGVALIKRAWIEFTYAPSDENNIMAAHGDILTLEVQNLRLDHLLATGDAGGAKRQLARVDVTERRLGTARLEIQANPASVKSVLAKLPVSDQADPEFMLEVAKALRRLGDDDEAWVVMEKAPTDKSALVLPARWSAERQIMARDALKTGKVDLAYRFASAPVLDSSSGGTFMDAEFLSGWIALRYLHNTDLAYRHFERLLNGVTYPISVARARYWLGRTAEAAGDMARAADEYSRAAENPETFYGELAIAKLADNPLLKVTDATGTPSPKARAGFEQDERVRAIRLLAETGDRADLRQFATALVNEPPLPDQLQMLAQLLADTGDTAMSVRAAKAASYAGYILPGYLHPIVALPNIGYGPEPALVLAIVRQESEFDPAVVSSAGARGLMQVMPASAKRAADQLGISYRLADLTSNPTYNIQLGMQTLSQYLDLWNGSYILAIATYNAGPANVSRWVETYGDPRNPGVDPVDWIESIPFPETRNYVQRVIENLEVYRDRLGNTDRPLSIIADLYRPGTVEADSTKPIPLAAVQASDMTNAAPAGH
ncbi:MAG TPA: transglycosylase SLT domain-containing protein [Micropepsaceae bacterium]|nr:transglycosylase SLT domain-containing protein [Micropepsaceae bacterium]